MVELMSLWKSERSPCLLLSHDGNSAVSALVLELPDYEKVD